MTRNLPLSEDPYAYLDGVYGVKRVIKEPVVSDRKPIPITRAKKLLKYEPLTGRLRWRDSRGSRKAGGVAGTLTDRGLKIKIDGVLYHASRVAWAMYYGQQPPNRVIHVNQDVTDNRIDNLKDARST